MNTVTAERRSMKPREKDFCRLMTAYADPLRAAREAGYKNPDRACIELMTRDDIGKEINRMSGNIRSVYENSAVCGLYRLAYGGVGDPLTLVYRDDLTDEELSSLDLLNVSEIKRTKDKSIEIKFFDRIKAVEKLNDILCSDTARRESGGLLDAILRSAEALGSNPGVSTDEV